jgi:hypothetical protein
MTTISMFDSAGGVMARRRQGDERVTGRVHAGPDRVP